MVRLSDNLGRYLAITWRHMVAFMARKMEPLGIGAGQYAYLFALYLEDGQSQQSLSNRLLVDKSATVVAINKLEDLGYVERRKDEQDRRSYRLFVTEKGWRIQPQLKTIIGEILDILHNGMTEEEKITLDRLMQKAARNMSQAVRGTTPP